MSIESTEVPWSKLAEQIIASRIDNEIAEIERFQTGLSHFVVSVETSGGSEYVIRIATPERKSELVDGLLWHKRLDDLGVPLPTIYDSGEINGFHFVLYERLPGDDLESIYSSLGANSKKEIAASVAWIQERVAALDKEYFNEYPAWPDVITGIIDRSEEAIKAADGTVQKYFDTARKMATRYMRYLTAVEPLAFLYDLNIRNVIILDGRMSGVIDVDEIWFGDPLLAVGRGKALLLAMQQETDYIDYWCDYLKLSAEMLLMVDLYALLYCILFMATSGQKLNGNYSIQTDPENMAILKTAADGIIGKLS